MSTRAYSVSVLASLVLIAAPAAPVAQKFFTYPDERPDRTTRKLLVAGLSFATSAERLREFVGRVGGVESATLVTDGSTGQSRGFGFVEMASVEAADAAIRALNGQELDGQPLHIELASRSAANRSDFRGGAAGGSR